MSLRIAHVTTFYPPHNFGGDGIGIQRLVRALARRGHHNTVIVDTDAYTLLGKRDPDPTPDEPNIEVVRLSSATPKLSMLLVQQLGRPVKQARRLRELLESGRFDVINYHNVSLIGGPVVWSYGSALKFDFAHEHWLVCPSHVLWRHNRELCTGRECFRCQIAFGRPPQLWRTTSLLERHGRDVDTFLAMSEFSRAKHKEFGFPFEMQVLPYFLPERETPLETSSARLHARPYFLFVGRLEKIKGLDDVIPLMREYPDADLLIAGAGDYGKRLKELAGDAPNVRFLGRVPNHELAIYYAGCEALIVPSICYETFGIILIEAFQSGAPVIARRLGPFPEIVEASGGGELFSTGAELLAAMRRLQFDPPRAGARNERRPAAARSTNIGRNTSSCLAIWRWCGSGSSANDALERAARSCKRVHAPLRATGDDTRIPGMVGVMGRRGHGWTKPGFESSRTLRASRVGGVHGRSAARARENPYTAHTVRLLWLSSAFVRTSRRSSPRGLDP